MKKFFTLILTVSLLISLSGCFAENISFCYKESVKQDGFLLSINKTANCCFAGRFECTEYTDCMQISIPDEYNGIPVTQLGGYFGRGVLSPFSINVDMRLSENDAYPDTYPSISSFSSLPAGSKTKDILFHLYIGKNLKTIEFVDMDRYNPFFNEAGEVIYYHPVVYVTCSEENPNFYAKDGRLYYKNTDALVTEFAYADTVVHDDSSVSDA